jgi:hypothetical protein
MRQKQWAGGVNCRGTTGWASTGLVGRAEGGMDVAEVGARQGGSAGGGGERG